MENDNYFPYWNKKRLIDKENIMKQMNIMVNLAKNYINLFFNLSDNTSPAIHLYCGNAIEQWIIVSIAPIEFPFGWMVIGRLHLFQAMTAYAIQPN